MESSRTTLSIRDVRFFICPPCHIEKWFHIASSEIPRIRTEALSAWRNGVWSDHGRVKKENHFCCSTLFAHETHNSVKQFNDSPRRERGVECYDSWLSSGQLWEVTFGT